MSIGCSSEATFSILLMPLRASEFDEDAPHHDPPTFQSKDKGFRRGMGNVNLLDAVLVTKPVPFPASEEEGQSEPRNLPSLIVATLLPPTFSKQMAEDANWERSYSCLLEYYLDHGDCDVRPDDPDHRLLFDWIQEQRVIYVEGNMSESARSRLDQVNLDWSLSNVETDAPSREQSGLDQAWDEKFQRLIEYKTKTGNCRVPRFYKADKSLGLWVGNQRMLYRKGAMRPDRRRRLDQLGFEAVDKRYIWSEARNTSGLDAAWMGMYTVLLQYLDQFGHVDVPKNYVHSNKEALGRWVFRQRTNFAKGNIREDRKLKLDEVGFSWNHPNARFTEPLEPLDFRHVEDTRSNATTVDTESFREHDSEGSTGGVVQIHMRDSPVGNCLLTPPDDAGSRGRWISDDVSTAFHEYDKHECFEDDLANALPGHQVQICASQFIRETTHHDANAKRCALQSPTWYPPTSGPSTCSFASSEMRS